MRAALATIALLAACAAPAPPEGGPAGDGACDAPRYRALMDAPVDVLETMALPPRTRIIRPGMAVTMDYDPARLNFEIDRRNRIIRIWCG